MELIKTVTVVYVACVIIQSDLLSAVLKIGTADICQWILFTIWNEQLPVSINLSNLFCNALGTGTGCELSVHHSAHRTGSTDVWSCPLKICQRSLSFVRSIPWCLILKIVHLQILLASGAVVAAWLAWHPGVIVALISKSDQKFVTHSAHPARSCRAASVLPGPAWPGRRPGLRGWAGELESEGWLGHQPTFPSTCSVYHNVSWSIHLFVAEIGSKSKPNVLLKRVFYQFLSQFPCVFFQDHFRFVIVDRESLLKKIGLQFPDVSKENAKSTSLLCFN